jgi:hypothetical protein
MTGREENLRGGNKFELLYWKVRSRGATDAASWSTETQEGTTLSTGKRVCETLEQKMSKQNSRAGHFRYK